MKYYYFNTNGKYLASSKTGNLNTTTMKFTYDTHIIKAKSLEEAKNTIKKNKL